MKTFERLESEVRGYCRSFPTVFTKASGHTLTDAKGRRYIDFFAGAGVLNYGHNNPKLKAQLMEYIAGNGVIHSLDMATAAKEEFLKSFERIVLEPRKLPYKVMFPGPTGTNSVEAALKLARKVTGRTNVIAFTNAFHGMTLGSLALTGNIGKRRGAGVPLTHVDRVPFDSYLGTEVDTIDVLEQYLQDGSSGFEPPAAIIVESVQAEGGVNVASRQWLARLSQVARRFGSLLILDDIQVGCGRTGPFFSFEPAEIVPDIVCLSKSLSGYGLPFAVTLMKPELDQWQPGEHNGTFRGHNLAFVTARAALENYWTTPELTEKVNRDARTARETLLDLAEEHGAEVRGRGLIQGIQFPRTETASEISAAAFERGLIIETAGPNDEVLKLLPPLTIDEEGLQGGLEIVRQSVQAVLGQKATGVKVPVTNGNGSGSGKGNGKVQ